MPLGSWWMKQNSQWLSQVRTRSNRAEATSIPSGSPRPPWPRARSSSSMPPRRTSRLEARPRPTSRLVLDDVAGSWPSTDDELVAGEEAGVGAPGTRGPPRPPGAPTWTSGYPVPAPAPPAGPGHGAGSLGRVAVERVLLASPAGSAPAWRWPSRPWPGWCGSSSRPSTATTRSSTTGSWSTGSGPAGWSSSTTWPRCPPGAPLMLSAHGSAPEVVDAARASGGVVVDAVCPLVTKVHHELKVRAGKGYTVLYVGHDGPRGGGRAPWPWRPPSVRLVRAEADVDWRLRRDRPRAPPWRCWPRPRSATTSGRASWTGAAAAVPRPVDAQPQRPVLRHHQPAGRAEGHRRPVRRRGRHRLGELLQHAWPSRRWPGPSGCPRVLRVNEAAELPDDLPARSA